MRVAVVAVCLLSLAAPLQVSAQTFFDDWPEDEWSIFQMEDDGGILLFNKVRLKESPPKAGRRFSVMKGWIATDYRQVKAEKARSQKTQFNVDCSGDRIFFSASYTYSAAGTVLRKFDVGDRDHESAYANVVPGSMGSLIADYACGRKELPKFEGKG